MITQRTRSGGTANAAAIAGNAMFIMESSETTSAPAAATHRDIPRMMTRHARSDRLGRPRRRRARGLPGRRRRGIRHRDHHAAARRVGARPARGGAGADGDDVDRQPGADLVVPRRGRPRGRPALRARRRAGDGAGHDALRGRTVGVARTVRRSLPDRVGAVAPSSCHGFLSDALESLPGARRRGRTHLGARGHDRAVEHALLPRLWAAPERVRRDRGRLRDGHAPLARRRARALRAAHLGDLRGGGLARRDDVRRLVDRAPLARPDERSRVPLHHRGAAAPDGLALASVSAVKPDLVDIKVGATAEVSYTVDEGKTAHAMGNRGVHVFATPFVIGMLEDAAGAVMRPHFPPGAGSVGTMVEMKHLAATPVGLKVRAKATLLESDGKRFLFSIEAWDDKEKIAEGRHERFFVPDMEKFLARAMKKSAS